MSTELQGVRNAMTNFIGAMAVAMPLEPKIIRQELVAILTEEILRIAQDKDGVYDLFALKPVFRAQIAILRQRNAELKGLDVEAAKEQIILNEKIIGEYSRLIESLK